jgi:hypothetical protein
MGRSKIRVGTVVALLRLDACSVREQPIYARSLDSPGKTTTRSADGDTGTSRACLRATSYAETSTKRRVAWSPAPAINAGGVTPALPVAATSEACAHGWTIESSKVPSFSSLLKL